MSGFFLGPDSSIVFVGVCLCCVDVGIGVGSYDDESAFLSMTSSPWLVLSGLQIRSASFLNLLRFPFKDDDLSFMF